MAIILRDMIFMEFVISIRVSTILQTARRKTSNRLFLKHAGT
jgi:hypothetical protein